jgi:uronate dehydrogenase
MQGATAAHREETRMTKTIAVTGAAGQVARMIRPLLAERYSLVLSDRTDAPDDLRPHERWHKADLSDRPALGALLDGVDGIVHLGGQSVESDWDTVRDANIEGLFNVFDACREKGVGRVIFASSNHAVGFYPRVRRIGIDAPVRPDGYYGLSKAFGEAMGSLFADKHGLRVMSIRIGNVADRPADHRRLSIWLHPEDLVQLISIGLDHPDLHHAIVYGASHCERAWWDNATAFALGYRPRHRAEDHADHAMARQAELDPDPIGDRFQGGGFCSAGFDGDLERTENAI